MYARRRIFRFRHIAAFFQNIINFRDFLFKFFSPFPDRFQFFLHNIIQEFFNLYIPKAASGIMILHLLNILVLRKITGKLILIGKCLQINKYRIPFHLSRILNPEMARIGKHGHNFLTDLFLRIRQINTVI